jgi:hypothetical protein
MDFFTEFTDHLAVRKILQGVKGRVEGHIEPMARGNLEFGIFLVSALLFFISIVLLLIRPLNRQRWLTGFLAGVVWLVTWYAPVSIWMAVLLELWILWMMRGNPLPRLSRKGG